MDDVLVFGKNQTEHDKNLHAVLKRLSSAAVTLNTNECEFSKPELGHIVNKHGVQADPDKTKIIVKMQPPKKISEM